MAVILLGATLAISHGVEFQEKIPIKKSFAGFPLKVSKWIGVRESMEQKFIDELDLSDYVIVNYKGPEGRSVNFYVAYYETQRKGESIHSPSTCLPGSGWIFNQAGEIDIPTPGYHGGSMRVRRAFMQKGAYRQLSYYWFFAERPYFDQCISVEDLQFLGCPDQTQDGRRSCAYDHAGL